MRLERCATAAVLATALAACGGGGGSAAPAPPSIKAVDDSFDVPAGAPANLAVLANDTATGGTAQLTIATHPARGTLTVQGMSLSYTPDPGFYGVDQFTYRVDVGSASGVAAVRLTVEAALELSGNVTPSAGNGMEVVAQVGERQFTATTDAQGAYKIIVKSSRADAFVSLNARGTETKASLAMGSLVGDFGVLLAAADGSRLNAAKWPALSLDALSSARQGLLAQRGSLPADTAALRRAIPRINPDDLIDTVTQFRRVAEGGASLPEGVPTTLKLVSEARALAAAHSQALAGTDGFSGMSPTVSAVADVSPPAVGAQGSLLAVLGTSNLVFELKPDGSASFFVFNGRTGGPDRVSGRWAYEGDALRITVTDNYVGHEWTYRGFLLRKVRNADPQSRPELLLSEHASYRFCSTGPVAPACEFAWSAWKPVISFDVQRDKLPLTMADFAANTRWAGVAAPNGVGQAICLCPYAQSTTFNGTLSFGATTGQLIAGSLQFSGTDPFNGNYAQRYTRLWQGDDNIEYWLTESEIEGVVRNRELRAVVKAPEARLDAAKAARRWLIPGAPGQLNPSESAGQEVLRSDGSWRTVVGSTSVENPSRTWKLSSDGTELLLLNNGFRLAEYYIVAAIPGGYLAFGTPGLVRLRDLGPAD